ncbi:hypothetical protein LTR85_000582 [Meristemomyces frigidus]|nr:hypothetical protein LTR85_000582 [Meristemomyces frigidus]
MLHEQALATSAPHTSYKRKQSTSQSFQNHAGMFYITTAAAIPPLNIFAADSINATRRPGYNLQFVRYIRLERIDATKMNELLGTMDNPQSNDVYRYHCIKIGGLGSDKRHRRLSELFSLVSRLEGTKVTMGNHIALHPPKKATDTPKPIKANDSLTAAMQRVIRS